MARSWFLPARTVESTAAQLVATGAAGGWGVDPVDGDTGYRPLGTSGREIPSWTLDKARAFSVAGYRTNPMARAIIDTYTSFCVGDSGVTLQCHNAAVRQVAEAFWRDPRVNAEQLQEPWLRDHMLMGESVVEPMVGERTGIVRISIIDPSRITDVGLLNGNPLWPATLGVRQPGQDDLELEIVGVDDMTGLRTGQVMFWPSWRALLTDRRGFPFLGPVLDDLDAYDNVLSNLIDRTALARYLVFDVTLDGMDDKAIAEWIKTRGGNHVPRSGSIEAHNEKVKWEAKSADVGSFEDTNTAKAILTNVAGGAGLAKTWLADPEDANRATSLTMAEPVRRRVSGVQNLWLWRQTELVRFAVDRAVAAGRLDAQVPSGDVASAGALVPASQTVRVGGPEVAAADAQVTATVLANLSQGLIGLVGLGALTKDAAGVAARKAWEQFVGIPYTAALDNPDGSRVDDLAEVIDTTPGASGALAKLATTTP